ncbi:hypothetical protein AACH06_17140 [Ideonella sp. DXS29W]|uniref:DUF4340 domain-containing protein n=1 Tax=Ideonella lacteola TaxID=2984193 RepID=A0ABU9BUJ2_9BURK
MTDETPTPEAQKTTAKRPNWWKWPIRLLAGLGALTLIVVGMAWFTASRKAEPVHFSADEMIDQIMLSTYGKYSESAKGWMYVDDQRQMYVMRVVHRAKIVDAEGHEELYFVASGDDGADTFSREAIIGAFKVMADPDKTDGSLIQISQPFMQGMGSVALAREDIRFEALSNKTFGWVLKTGTTWHGEDADGREVMNRVVAPSSSSMAVVATFPASIKAEVEGGCADGQARYADWVKSRQERQDAGPGPAAASSAASSASASESGDDESDVEGDDEPPLRCSDATFSYKTDPVPEDGFVAITVSASGKLNGDPVPTKTWKLVFDHKSFTYLVPDDLKAFSAGY